jgi:hypothetical protein
VNYVVKKILLGEISALPASFAVKNYHPTVLANHLFPIGINPAKTLNYQNLF